MRRHTFAMLASAALLAGCSQDEVVTAQGGGAFEASFATVTPLRTPTMIAMAYGRTIGAIVEHADIRNCDRGFAATDRRDQGITFLANT